MRLRSLIAGAAALVLHAGAAAAAPDGAGAEDAERSLLQRSWEDSCGAIGRAGDLAGLEACNGAWFRAHEKAVWHLNLNPHGATTAQPSS